MDDPFSFAMKAGGEQQPVIESHRESEFLHRCSSLFAQTLGLFEVFRDGPSTAAIVQTVGFVETGRETTGRFSAGHLAFRAGWRIFGCGQQRQF